MFERPEILLPDMTNLAKCEVAYIEKVSCTEDQFQLRGVCQIHLSIVPKKIKLTDTCNCHLRLLFFVIICLMTDVALSITHWELLSFFLLKHDSHWKLHKGLSVTSFNMIVIVQNNKLVVLPYFAINKVKI